MNTIFHDIIGEVLQVYIDDIVVKSKYKSDHVGHLRQAFERMRKYGLKMNLLKCAFGVIAGQFLGFIVHQKGIEIDNNKAKAIYETQAPSTKKQLQSLLRKINFLQRFISNLSGKVKIFSPLLKLKKEKEFRWEAKHQAVFEEIKQYLTKPPVMVPPKKGFPLKLYISTSEETIGSMLAQEDKNGVERAVYYLSRMGVDGTLLRCLSEHEAYIALAKIHEGICGAHQAGERMKWMLLREGLYWPSMVKDCFDYAKSCEECQKHGNIQHVPASELHSIIKPWSFRGWALDLVGQIHPPSTKGHKYIIVAVNYFMKWAEAVPLKEVTKSDVVNFINEYIIHRFGIPETLTTDQGTVFIGRKVTQYAESLNIKMITSTPYYAQANGQVEAKAVLPVEVNLQSVRLQRQFKLPSEDYWALMFDELNVLDEIRLSALEKIIRQKERITRSYNRKVRGKFFNAGELVWKVILPFDKKSRKLGKWSPNWEGPFEIENVFSNNAYSIRDLGTNSRIMSINGKYLKPYKPEIHEVKIT
ncbi:uncharacterized protein K02A2.6-like [Abrus precatorius]|uniref:Uncharacterized protein K02A2.6-like n=1 Tax=Abrus precatorius TaxID=3816 RepID=A0A8B8K0W4_ABRPR|nr:uncharacterized protein K02A2.6-like [Abrus precatorius]